MQRRSLVALLVLGLSWGLATCSEEPIKDVNGDGQDDGVAATTVIAPSNPTGTVSGVVVNAATGEPLPEGRSFFVQLVAGAYGGSDIGVTQEISDGSGQYRFLDVPAGNNISVRVSADGFAPATAQVTLNATVGNFFADNASVNAPTLGLVDLSGELGVFLVAADGRPVGNAEIYLDTDFSYFTNNAPAGSMHLSATSAEDGIATFTGLPNAALFAHQIGNRQFVITVPPQDIDGQAPADLAGTIQTISLNDAALRVNPLTIVLQYGDSDDDLRVVASNIGDLVNSSGSSPDPKPTASVLPKTGSIYVAFNQPVDLDSFLLRMVGEEGGNYLPISVDENSFNPYHNILTLALPDEVQAGQEYNMFIEARPAAILGGTSYRGAVAFFIEPSEVGVQVLYVFHEERNGLQSIEAPDYLWFQLNVPVGARDDQGAPVSYNNMLPIRIQLSNANVGAQGEADQPIEFGYTGESLAPEAYLIEKMPEGGQYRASGYTSWLRLQVPAGITIPTGPVTWHFSFNNTVGANSSQNYRVTTPQGVLPDPGNKSANINLDENYDYPVPDAGSPDAYGTDIN